MAIDMSAAVKAPPAKRATAVKKTAPAVTATPAEPAKPLQQQRYEGLLGIAQLAQGGCILAGLHADAMTIGQYFPPIALEVAKIADDNETVAQPVDFLIKVGPYGALITAAMPFVLQILANHKIIDASKAMGMGIVPPEVMAAQMKAQVAKMQAEALQAQQQAINDANAAVEAYNKLMAETTAQHGVNGQQVTAA